MTAEQERAAIVRWLRLPRKARAANIGLRVSMATVALFRPNLLVQWMNEAMSDCIERLAHHEKDQSDD